MLFVFGTVCVCVCVFACSGRNGPRRKKSRRVTWSCSRKNLKGQDTNYWVLLCHTAMFILLNNHYQSNPLFFTTERAEYF